MHNLQDILHFTREIAVEAGKLVVKIRGSSDFKINHKSSRDLVTSADTAAEKLILTNIKNRYPDHEILSEEFNFDILDAERLYKPLWIIDPIDGTTNFAKGHNHFAVSIAFADKGKILVGVVYAPAEDTMYHAIKGGGAYCNDKKISPSDVTDPENSLLATGFPPQRTENVLFPIIKRIRGVLDSYQDIRRLGAASLDICWVASGKLDGYWEDVKPWDMAAGSLVAREAGATVGNYLRKNKELLPEELVGDAFFCATKGISEKLKDLLARQG